MLYKVYTSQRIFAIIKEYKCFPPYAKAVDAEGSKVMDELRNDAFKEIIKGLMRG